MLGDGDGDDDDDGDGDGANDGFGTSFVCFLSIMMTNW